MASNNSRILFNLEALTASKTSAPKITLTKDVNFVAFLKSSNAVAANYAVKIQHSPNGIDWFDLVTFTAVTGNTFEKISLDNTTNFVLEHIRAVATRTLGTVTLSVSLLHDRI